MRNSIPRSLFLAALLLLCFTVGAFAEQATLVYNGVNGYSMGGVYTSPYNINVNGTPTWLICIDFGTELYTGSGGWTADVTTLAPPTGGFATAAVLAGQLMGMDFHTDAAAEISYAIWSIFDSGLRDQLKNESGSGVTTLYGYLTHDQVQGILGFLSQAQNAGAIPNLTLYTPTSVPPNSQRFIQVSVPEPSLIALLGVDLLAVAGLILCVRRHMAAVR
jgi:hypothetical protein